MPANPLTSDGARQERKAMRAFLRRRLVALKAGPEYQEVERALAFVDQRRKRYDVATGGLGRQVRKK